MQLPDIERAIEALTPQQREELYRWIEKQNAEYADVDLKPVVEAGCMGERINRAATGRGVLEEMRALRARIKPDSEGWTTRDYVRYGRR